MMARPQNYVHSSIDNLEWRDYWIMISFLVQKGNMKL